MTQAVSCRYTSLPRPVHRSVAHKPQGATRLSRTPFISRFRRTGASSIVLLVQASLRRVFSLRDSPSSPLSGASGEIRHVKKSRRKRKEGYVRREKKGFLSNSDVGIFEKRERPRACVSSIRLASIFLSTLAMCNPEYCAQGKKKRKVFCILYLSGNLSGIARLDL